MCMWWISICFKRVSSTSIAFFDLIDLSHWILKVRINVTCYFTSFWDLLFIRGWWTPMTIQQLSDLPSIKRRREVVIQILSEAGGPVPWRIVYWDFAHGSASFGLGLVVLRWFSANRTNIEISMWHQLRIAFADKWKRDLAHFTKR